MPIVLDASMALTWCFAAEATTESRDVLRALGDDAAFVPTIWPLEITNALLIAERRGRLTMSELGRFIHLLRSLSIELDGVTLARATDNVFGLARVHALTAYDAAYLELAIRLELPLATLDSRLRAAATRAGVIVKG